MGGGVAMKINIKAETLQKKNTEPALVRDCCMSMKVSINLI